MTERTRKCVGGLKISKRATTVSTAHQSMNRFRLWQHRLQVPVRSVGLHRDILALSGHPLPGNCLTPNFGAGHCFIAIRVLSVTLVPDTGFCSWPDFRE